jgi:hypothetical protein
VGTDAAIVRGTSARPGGGSEYGTSGSCQTEEALSLYRHFSASARIIGGPQSITSKTGEDSTRRVPVGRWSTPRTQVGEMKRDGGTDMALAKRAVRSAATSGISTYRSLSPR